MVEPPSKWEDELACTARWSEVARCNGAGFLSWDRSGRSQELAAPGGVADDLASRLKHSPYARDRPDAPDCRLTVAICAEARLGSR